MPQILLVEDNEMNRDMLSRRLERRGYKITLAIDGVQAVNYAEIHQPDIILMDMDLPIKDGWTASREIKQHTATCNIPIIALTAHAMAGDLEKALSAGCDDYETKPVEFNRLVAKIEQYLQRH